MGQLYLISNIRNYKSYVGIVYAKDKTYLERFKQHMTCKGAKLIADDISNTRFKPDDFIVQMIEESDDIQYLRDREIYFIKQFNTLTPNGYNGNCGNVIIMTDEVKKKIQETNKRNRELGKHRKHGISLKGMAMYRLPDGINMFLPTNHPDVVSGKVKHVNYREADKRYEEVVQRRNEERKKNNGITDKQLEFFRKRSEIWKQFPEKAIHHTPGWLEGKRKFRERLKRREFTEKERTAYSKRTEQTKQQWNILTKEDRKEITQPGLNIMNMKYTCQVCGTETNKGNLKRWHNTNCKKGNIHETN